MDIAIAGAGVAATDISSSGHEGLLDLPGDLLDMLPAAVYVCDADGLIVRCNRKAVELWSRTPKLGDREERFCGSWRMHRLDGGPLPHEECPMADVLRTGQVVRDQEVVIERSDGSRITALVNISPLRNTAGAIVGAVNCFQDITERQRADEALRGALRDKEVLLRELQHRTKNNLQVVASLLGLKARETPHAEARRDIEDVRKRVETLALVHDQFLRFKSVDRIELAAYLRELCTKLLDFAEMNPEKVTLDLRLEEVTVGADKAAPLGLIVNEIVSNSLKHAFPTGRGGLRMELTRDDDGMARLVIADDGPGIPPAAKAGLGRGLIHGLAMQIRADIAVTTDRGTRYMLTFPA